MTRKETRRRGTQGKATVWLCVGGTSQPVARLPGTAQADIIIHADVGHELAQAGVHRDVLQVALAAGETLDTLLARGCPGPLEKFLAGRPGVSLSIGLCQQRGVGRLAAELLLKDPEFHRLLVTELLERLLLRHNGCLREVEIVVFSSTAGGTGGPVGPALARAAAQVLLDHTDAVVHLAFLRAGSLSYVTLGEMLHRNTAATVDEDVAFVCDSEHHPREVRSLVLFELPMRGPRADLREADVIQFAQAYCSRQVQEVLRRQAPNQALASPFGNILVARASYARGLSRRRTAGEVAAGYAPKLRRVLDAGPLPGYVEEIRVALRQQPEGVPACEELIATARRARGVMPPEFADTCRRPPARYAAAAVSARLNDTETNLLDLGDGLAILCAAPCKTVAALTQRLGLLAALDHALDAAINERAGKLASLRGQLRRAEAVLRRALALVFPANLIQKLWALLTNAETRLDALKHAVNRMRELGDAKSRLEAEAQALRAARTRVANELSAERGRVQHVLDALVPHVSRETGGRAPLIEAADLDSVLADLLEAAHPERPETAVLELLGACARRAEREGLAEVLEAPDARVPTLAGLLARPAPATVAPAWGGKEPLTAGEVLAVLPPVSEQTLEELRTALGDSDVILASADSAQGGVNVVWLEVFTPRRREEIFPPFLNKNLELAHREPGVFCTNGTHTPQTN